MKTSGCSAKYQYNAVVPAFAAPITMKVGSVKPPPSGEQPPWVDRNIHTHPRLRGLHPGKYPDVRRQDKDSLPDTRREGLKSVPGNLRLHRAAPVDQIELQPHDGTERA